MTLIVFFWLFLSIICFGFGEYFSKIFTTTPTVKIACFVVFSYALGSLSWLPAIYKVKLLAVVGTVWTILSLLMTLFIGLVIFHEPITTFQIVGIAFGLVSVILLTI
jgi:multidrug transporter EmrE-like cation transporter